MDAVVEIAKDSGDPSTDFTNGMGMGISEKVNKFMKTDLTWKSRARNKVF